MSAVEEDRAGTVRLTREGAVATVTFDRPHARNAMTKRMYHELREVCETVSAEADMRAVVFRGAGDKAFVAGSDVGIFSRFESGADGVAYEREMEIYIQALAAIPVPTLAAVDGWAVGGGLNLAAACDLRIATAGSKFGVPIARTIGNCLSMANYARLIQAFGEGRAKRMLLLGEILNAEEIRECGFLTEIVPEGELDAAVERLCTTLVGNAPVTLRVSKQAMARVGEFLPDEGADLIEECYGSHDFQQAVASFMAGERPTWQGR